MSSQKNNLIIIRISIISIIAFVSIFIFTHLDDAKKARYFYEIGFSEYDSHIYDYGKSFPCRNWTVAAAQCLLSVNSYRYENGSYIERNIFYENKKKINRFLSQVGYSKFDKASSENEKEYAELKESLYGCYIDDSIVKENVKKDEDSLIEEVNNIRKTYFKEDLQNNIFKGLAIGFMVFIIGRLIAYGWNRNNLLLCYVFWIIIQFLLIIIHGWGKDWDSELWPFKGTKIVDYYDWFDFVIYTIIPVIVYVIVILMKNANSSNSYKIESSIHREQVHNKIVNKTTVKEGIQGKVYSSEEALQELERWKRKLDLQIITKSEYDKKKEDLMKFID